VLEVGISGRFPGDAIVGFDAPGEAPERRITA
jgi:hypothetical protein